MRKTIRGTMAAALAVLAGLTTGAVIAAAAAPPASAHPAVTVSSTLPKTQAAGMGGNWSCCWAVRPSGIAYGADFVVENLRWQYYTRGNAYATHGTLYTGSGIPAIPNATVYVWDVFWHSGPGYNFGYLRLKWVQGGHQHSMLMWINSSGEWSWNGA